MCACVLARCDVKAEGAAGLRANKANNRLASMRLQFAGRRARPMNPCKEDPFQEHGPSARPGACTITPSVCGYLQAMGNPQAAERGESMATMEAKSSRACWAQNAQLPACPGRLDGGQHVARHRDNDALDMHEP